MAFNVFHWEVMKTIGFHYFLQKHWKPIVSLLFQEEQRTCTKQKKTKLWRSFGPLGAPRASSRATSQMPLGAGPGAGQGSPKMTKRPPNFVFFCFVVFPDVLHHLPYGKCWKTPGKTKKTKKMFGEVFGQFEAPRASSPGQLPGQLPDRLPGLWELARGAPKWPTGLQTFVFFVFFVHHVLHHLP